MPRKKTQAESRKQIEDTHIATFEAYIEPIKSAILFGADGAQVKIAIPGTDLDAALALARNAQNKILRIVVFEGETSGDTESRE